MNKQNQQKSIRSSDRIILNVSEYLQDNLNLSTSILSPKSTIYNKVNFLTEAGLPLKPDLNS